MKFKVGDVVCIKSWDDMANEFGMCGSSIACKFSFPYTMKPLCGKEFTISRIDKEHGIVYGLDTEYNISADMLEFVCDDREITESEEFIDFLRLYA